MAVPIPLRQSKTTIPCSSRTALSMVLSSRSSDEKRFWGNATHHYDSLAVPLQMLISVTGLHFVALLSIIWNHQSHLLQTDCKDSLYSFSLNSRLSSDLNTRFASYNSRWHNTTVDEKWQTAKLVVYPTQPQPLLSQQSLFSSTMKFEQFILRGKNSFHDFITVVMIPAGVSFKAYSGKSMTP